MGREHSTDGGRRVGREHTSMRVEREPAIVESSEEVWLLTPGEGRPAIAFAKAVAGMPAAPGRMGQRHMGHTGHTGLP